MKDVPEQIIIDGVKYVREPEPEKPEYESVKLVYNWDDNIEPVNRRWDDLTDFEKSIIDTTLEMRISNKNIFYVVYSLITGEQHP